MSHHPHLLDALERSRRVLLAEVAHELLTPLTAIRGHVDMLRMREASLDEETKHRYLDVIEQECSRLETLVGDLRDLAVLEAGGGELTRQPVRTADLFGRIKAAHDLEATRRRLTVTVSVAADAAIVQGDERRLEQALDNLVRNALRHVPDGGRVALEAGASATEIWFRVVDNGPGIPPEHLPFVFDRFYKAGPSAGSGLGLSIVKAIAERHGGGVRASSQPGIETVFTLVFPRS